MTKIRKPLLALVLLLTLALLCACKQNPSDERLYAKLFDFFEARGMTCAFVSDAPVSDPAIDDASVWKTLDVSGETVYVYFDESNRADYLLSQIDQSRYGYATRFGLRFVLNYRGSDEKTLAALQEME